VIFIPGLPGKPYPRRCGRPYQHLMTVTATGQVVVKSLFDGTSGFTESMGNKKPFTEQQIKGRKHVTAIIEQLDYLQNPAIIAQVKGIEKLAGADAYKIDITFPTGNVRSEYYDLQSKLLVKREETETENATTTTTTQVYTNYKKAGNIYYPFDNVLTITTNGQQQVITMKASMIKFNEGVTAADFK
jgi:hypothetical protein